MQTARIIDTDGLSDNAIYLRNEIKSVVKTRLGLEAMVTDNLHHITAELLAKAPLPPPLGGILASMLMLVDWEGIARKPSADAVRELARLKRQVEGARL